MALVHRIAANDIENAEFIPIRFVFSFFLFSRISVLHAKERYVWLYRFRAHGTSCRTMQALIQIR